MTQDVTTSTGRRLDSIIARLRALEDTGTIQAHDALRIGKLPPRADGLFAQGYLHEVYASLDDGQLADLEDEAGRAIPVDLHAFYRQANGLSLFCGSFSIGGLRTDFTRSVDLRVPISLRYGNLVERPMDAPSSALSLGFYSAGDGHVLWFDDGVLYLTPMHAAAPRLRTWKDIWTFLDEEVERLSREYLARNGRVDPLDPLPPPL